MAIGHWRHSVIESNNGILKIEVNRHRMISFTVGDDAGCQLIPEKRYLCSIIKSGVVQFFSAQSDMMRINIIVAILITGNGEQFAAKNNTRENCSAPESKTKLSADVYHFSMVPLRERL